MKWRTIVAPVVANRLARAAARYGIPALAGGLAVMVAELPPALADALAQALCGSS